MFPKCQVLAHFFLSREGYTHCCKSAWVGPTLLSPWVGTRIHVNYPNFLDLHELISSRSNGGLTGSERAMERSDIFIEQKRLDLH